MDKLINNTLKQNITSEYSEQIATYVGGSGGGIILLGIIIGLIYKFYKKCKNEIKEEEKNEEKNEEKIKEKIELEEINENQNSPKFILVTNPSDFKEFNVDNFVNDKINNDDEPSILNNVLIKRKKKRKKESNQNNLSFIKKENSDETNNIPYLTIKHAPNPHSSINIHTIKLKSPKLKKRNKSIENNLIIVEENELYKTIIGTKKIINKLNNCK